MPRMTHGQHLAGLAQAPKAGPVERPVYVPDAPDLFERWLACGERLLAQDRVSSTELEACRIGIRPQWREGDERAVELMARLNEAEKRAWRFTS